MEGKLSELEVLERELLKLAKEINMDEKHVRRFFDGTYTSISLTKKNKEKMVVLLSQVAHDGSGKVNNPVIKATSEKNREIIAKMEKFVELVRAYRVLKKAEEVRQRIREGLAVAFAF